MRKMRQEDKVQNSFSFLKRLCINRVVDTGGRGCHSTFENMLKQAREEKKTAKERKTKSSFQQQLLELQQNQLQSFQDSELRMQEMMLKIFEEPRKTNMAEREKERECMLQLRKSNGKTALKQD